MFLVSGLLVTGAFAKGNYHPSISISEGVSFIGKEKTGSRDGENYKGDGFSFNSCFQYWNMWDLNEKFQLGFVVDLEAKVGTFTYVKVEGQNSVRNGNYFIGLFTHIGVAAAYQINNIIKLQGSFGVGGGVTPITSYPKVSYGQDGWAFGYEVLGAGIFFDLQAKFLPTKMFSPIVGYNFSNLSFTSRESIAGVKYNPKTTQIINTIYLGCALNFK